MDPTERIKTAVARGVQALELRPTMGRGTAVTTARLRDGLACEVVDGRWRLAADLSERAGGTGSAPDPGVFGRGALATCLAVGYAMWAARLGVSLDSLEVRVEADYDVRGELGMTDDPPSYSAVRCEVSIGSSASPAQIENLVATAEQYSPYLDLYRRPIPVTTVLRLLDKED